MRHNVPTQSDPDSPPALRKSEKLYKLLVQNTTAIILRVDRQARIIFANDRALRFFGYSADELIGKHAVGTIIPATESSGRDLAEMVREIAKNPDHFHANVNENTRKNGERVWLEWTNTGIYDDDGSLREFLAVGIDITERKKAETDVERLLALMDHNPSLVFLKDEDGRYVYLNKAYEKQFAVSTNWYGKTDFDLWPRESAELFRSHDADVLRSGRLKQFLEDSQGLDGKRYCWLCNKFPFTDSSGRKYVGGIGIDATSRVSTEEALRAAKEKYQRLFDTANDGFWWSDGEGCITEANEGIAEMLGCHVEEVVGRHWKDFVYQDLESINRAEKRWAESKAGGSSRFDFRLKRNDGTPLWVAVSRLHMLDEQGRHVGNLAAFRDITEHRRAEEALRESEERANALIRYAPTGIYELDYSIPAITSVNEAMCALSGYSREELLSTSPMALLTDESKQRFADRMRRKLAGEDIPDTADFQVIKKDGEVIDVALNISFPQDKPNTAFVIGHDITERKRAEEALRESESTRKVAEAVETERQRLRDVLETLPALICLLTPDYHVAFANRSFREKFGESNGRHCYEYCFGLSEPCEFCESYNVLKTGRPHQWEWACPDGTIIAAHDYPFTDADGTPMILEMDLDITEQRKNEAELIRHREHLQELVQERTVQLENANVQLEVQMTEREQIEEALKESEERLRFVLQSCRIGAWDMGIEDHATIRSLEHDRIYGYDEMLPEWTYEMFIDHVIPEDRVMVDTVYQEAIENQSSWSFEFRIRRPDDQIRWIWATGDHKRGPDGATRRVAGIVLDITERKKAEAVAQAAKETAEEQSRLLQRALMPATRPDVEGYSIATAYVPMVEGTEIGGDFMDVFRTEDGKLGILIGDVSGKGIEAAALGATTRSTIHAFAYDMSSPGYALAHANALLVAGQPGDMRFVTAFLMILDPATGNLVCSSAGHPAALVSTRDGEMHLLCAPNAPLGVAAGTTYVESHYAIRPGERLVLYTDGVTDARHGLNLFGTEGIENVLAANRKAGAEKLVQEILGTVKDWAEGNLRDDTAVLVLSRDGGK